MRGPCFGLHWEGAERFPGLFGWHRRVGSSTLLYGLLSAFCYRFLITHSQPDPQRLARPTIRTFRRTFRPADVERQNLTLRMTQKRFAPGSPMASQRSSPTMPLRSACTSPTTTSAVSMKPCEPRRALLWALRIGCGRLAICWMPRWRLSRTGLCACTAEFHRNRGREGSEHLERTVTKTDLVFTIGDPMCNNGTPIKLQ